MLLYIILPSVFLVCAVLYEVFGKKKALTIVFSAVFGLGIFLPAALRYYVGTDYLSYIQLYRYVSMHSVEEAMSLAHEKGFLIPIRIMSVASESYLPMFVFTALFISAGCGVYAYRHSANITISAMAYVMFGTFFYSMNFMRQFLAGVVIMYALEYAAGEKRSFFRYCVLILFASVFHWSALVMIPFWFILQIKLDGYMLGAYLCVSAMIFFFSEDIIQIGIQSFYTKYISDYKPDIGGGLSLYYLIGYSVIFIFSFFCRKELFKRGDMNAVLLGCAFFTAMFELLGAKHAMLSRFTLMFITPVLLRLIPEVFEIYKAKLEKIRDKKFTPKQAFAAVLAVFTIGGAVFYSCLLINGSNGVIPYRTYIGIDKGELV